MTAFLAQRVMGWTVGPDRFMMGNRSWLPRWRFKPCERLEDAFHLLERAAPQEYSMGAAASGKCWVKVRVAGTRGEAIEPSKARAIAYAVARAFGIDVESSTVSTIDAAGASLRCDE